MTRDVLWTRGRLDPLWDSCAPSLLFKVSISLQLNPTTAGVQQQRTWHMAMKPCLFGLPLFLVYGFSRALASLEGVQSFPFCKEPHRGMQANFRAILGTGSQTGSRRIRLFCHICISHLHPAKEHPMEPGLNGHQWVPSFCRPERLQRWGLSGTRGSYFISLAAMRCEHFHPLTARVPTGCFDRPSPQRAQDLSSWGSSYHMSWRICYYWYGCTQTLFHLGLNGNGSAPLIVNRWWAELNQLFPCQKVPVLIQAGCSAAI